MSVFRSFEVHGSVGESLSGSVFQSVGWSVDCQGTLNGVSMSRSGIDRYTDTLGELISRTISPSVGWWEGRSVDLFVVR